VADWVTISALATAGGTLALAGATFASVRSANRAARVAEVSLLANLRPLLLPSRLDDPSQKVGFADATFFLVPGGSGVAEVTDVAIYLVISVRNVGSGLAVLHGWSVSTRVAPQQEEHPPLDDFTMLSRDLYVAPNDVGFWQGAFRDPSAPEFATVRQAISARELLVIDILYGDHEGGQRVISRFVLQPGKEGTWIASAARHWNVDRADPRQR
jgi:hypothetical protein